LSVNPQPFGLSEQKELSEGHLADMIGKLITRLLEGCGLALDQFAWPLEVVGVPEFRLKCAEERGDGSEVMCSNIPDAR
jgi:hypothetical protein